MAVEVPQLAVPFRVEGGEAAVVEQGSDAEVLQCVEAVLRYRPGDRDDLPEFGTRDQAHQQGGARLAELTDAVERYEERVHAVAAREDDTTMGLVDRVRLTVARDTA